MDRLDKQTIVSLLTDLTDAGERATLAISAGEKAWEKRAHELRRRASTARALLEQLKAHGETLGLDRNDLADEVRAALAEREPAEPIDGDWTLAELSGRDLEAEAAAAAAKGTN